MAKDGKFMGELVLKQLGSQQKKIRKLKKRANRCCNCSLVCYQADLIQQMLEDDAVDERIRIAHENITDARFRSIFSTISLIKESVNNLVFVAGEGNQEILNARLDQILHDSNQEEWRNGDVQLPNQ